MSLGFLRTAPPAPLATYDRVASQSAALVIRGYSTSFGVASRLLAQPVRTHVRNIYALVRIADEVVDDPDVAVGPLAVGTAERAELLDRLEEDTARALRQGRSSNLVVHAFAGTARSCGIGMDLVEPFFASMRTDLHVTEHDADSLERYVYGSAEVVGLMCLRAFLAAPDAGSATYDELAPGARRLGAAFQKVNFLRDLAEDHDELGRTYFPGLRPEDLTDRDRDRILDDIEADLDTAARVVPLLPASSRRAVAAAHALFAELADRLRATPAAQIRRERVSVPSAVKVRVLARALVPGAAS
jgi:phytoene/squalene synthetase